MAVGVGVCALIFSVIFSGKIYFSIFTTVGTGFFAAPAFTLIFHKINKKYSVFIVTIIVGLFFFFLFRFRFLYRQTGSPGPVR